MTQIRGDADSSWNSDSPLSSLPPCSTLTTPLHYINVLLPWCFTCGLYFIQLLPQPVSSFRSPAPLRHSIPRDLERHKQLMMQSTERGRSRSRPARLEFSAADVGEAVRCAPTFKAKADGWVNHPQHPVPARDISLEAIKRKLARAHEVRKVLLAPLRFHASHTAPAHVLPQPHCCTPPAPECPEQNL